MLKMNRKQLANKKAKIKEQSKGAKLGNKFAALERLPDFEKSLVSGPFKFIAGGSSGQPANSAKNVLIEKTLGLQLMRRCRMSRPL